MTSIATAGVTPFAADLDSLERDGFSQDPQWIRALRKDAMSRFNSLGFPTARRGNEEWKYTDVRPIAQAPLRLARAGEAPEPTASDIAPFLLGDGSWPRLVFIDGFFNRGLSTPLGGQEDASVLSLAGALHSRSATARESLGRLAPYASHGFTALNTAFAHEGAFVHIPDGLTLEKPAHLIFLTASREGHTVSQPRVLVVAGAGSKAAVIETYGSLTGAPYLCNAVSEVAAGPGASVEYYRIQRHSEEAYHVGTTQAALGRDARLDSFTLDLGGALVRNNLNALIDAPDGSCALNGVYLATRSQRVDNQVTIDHAKERGTSRELYKGVLSGRAKAAFHGSIIVRKDAQKVDARQEDKNLLLSDRAEANVKPAFWIYADDVKCGHGAASGRIDEGSLFYLQSRGLGEEEARNLLVQGFVNEVIDKVKRPSVRSHVAELVKARLKEL